MFINWDINYGELSKDKDFIEKYDNLKDALISVQKVVDELLPLREQYDKMPLHEKVELDLFLAFALNSLYWILLRIDGIDPSKHPINDQLQRIKAIMVRWQQVKDREKRPKVDVQAAKRFVKSGLYDHKQTSQPPNKKIKFED